MFSRDVRSELHYTAHYLGRAAGRLDASTEYLREDIEDLQTRLGALLEKMSRDEALARDRDFLLALDPPAEGIAGLLGDDNG